MTKITLNRKAFIKTLTIGGTFAGKSRLMPILDCVKIKVSNGHLKVVSSDSENAINNSMIVDSADNDATFCVNFKDLMSYVKLVYADTLDMIIDDANVEIRHEKGNMKLPIMPADNFPTLKQDEDSKTVVVSSALINNWIIDARNFTYDDPLRPVLCGIYFYAKEGEIGCCASDGKSMYVNNEKADIDDFSFILNKNTFAAVCEACADVDDITLKIGSNNVMFIGNGVSVLARLLEGRFPNFKSVIPTLNPVKVKVDRKELIGALNRCKQGVSSASSLVKMAADGLTMNITAEDIDFNKSAFESVLIDSEGSITIGFNVDSLLKILNIVSTDKCVLNMSDASKPCLVTEDKDDSNVVFLQMPMMID